MALFEDKRGMRTRATPAGFVAYKGGIPAADSLEPEFANHSLPSSVAKLRAQLVAENALVLQDGCLRLTKDIAFTSPSPASALVKGRSSTGHGDWFRTTDRRKLGDVLRER